MSPVEMLQTIPVLRIFDAGKAREFYLDFLGFELDWEHRFGPEFPLYMQVSRGSLTLHLSEHHGDCTPGAKVFIWIQGIDEFHSEITSRGYRMLRPGIEETFYGARCVDVTDPFGNRISFNERIIPAGDVEGSADADVESLGDVSHLKR